MALPATHWFTQKQGWGPAWYPQWVSGQGVGHAGLGHNTNRHMEEPDLGAGSEGIYGFTPVGLQHPLVCMRAGSNARHSWAWPRNSMTQVLELGTGHAGLSCCTRELGLEVGLATAAASSTCKGWDWRQTMQNRGLASARTHEIWVWKGTRWGNLGDSPSLWP